MKKVGAVFLLFFIGVMFCFVLVLRASINPEKQILGTWEEVDWDYENNFSVKDDSSHDVKTELSKDLIIHKREIWKFLPNGVLQLSGEDGYENLEWRVKGRGHILQLKHQKTKIENYNIDLLNDSTMVINFEVDLEVRGIAKLTFRKTKIQYATKI